MHHTAYRNEDLMKMSIHIRFLLRTPIHWPDKLMSQICEIYACLLLSVPPSMCSDHHEAADRCNTTQSKTLPHVVYNLFSFWEPQKVLQPTTKQQQRKKTSLSKVLQLSSFTMPFAETWETIGGNSAEIVPLMKTNWRNQGSFLLPSQEANPNNMKLPKPLDSRSGPQVKHDQPIHNAPWSPVPSSSVQKKSSVLRKYNWIVHTVVKPLQQGAKMDKCTMINGLTRSRKRYSQYSHTKAEGNV